MKLINLEHSGRIIFVGDTHGDIEASKKIIAKYLANDTKIVFLGDYVDRGKYSRENINYLLEERKKYSDKIYLLLGNHDVYNILPCSPADFWESLDEEELGKYAEIFSDFPLVVSVGKIIALHGALPDIEKINDIEKIEATDENWMRILWGDFQPIKGGKLNKDAGTGRPQFGSGYFEKVMAKLNKNVLIRSHQPNAPEIMYHKRCLTIFTSSVYERKRTVAVADLEQEIRTTDDLKIEAI